jgi:DNA-binding NarL/FixJ family response regulator
MVSRARRPDNRQRVMEQVRALLLELPPLVRDILERAIDDAAGFEVMKEADASIARGSTPPDVVVLGLTGEQDAALVAVLFARWPRVQIVTVTQEGDGAVIYELRPRRRVLGDMSAAEIVKTLRDSVERNRHGSTDPFEDTDARPM